MNDERDAKQRHLDKPEAEQHRLMQAEKLINAYQFEKAKGRPAESEAELEWWCASDEGRRMLGKT
jgi:hypothetical protein